MKHLHLTLGYLREQRDRLDSSISLLETLLGGSNGNGHAAGGDRAMKAAATALALHHAGNGSKPGPQKRGPKPGSKRSAGSMRPLPAVTVPAGLDVSGLPLKDAIPTVLRAYKKPADTRTLTALLLAAGFKAAAGRTQPLTRSVGSLCGVHGDLFGVKGDRTGWRLR